MCVGWRLWTCCERWLRNFVIITRIYLKFRNLKIIFRYVIRDDSLGVLVTSYPPHRDGKEFIDALKLTFDEILRILHKRN